jgi:hypothetical protein
MEREFPRPWVREHWRRMFEETWAGVADTWDYQLVFAARAHGMVSLSPSVNLVRNVGFGAAGTRTHRRNRYAEMPVLPMEFPLVHPPGLAPLDAADRATEDEQYLVHSLPVRVFRAWRKIRRALAGPFRGAGGRPSA